MKKTLLTILAVALCFSCFGQKKWSEYPNKTTLTNTAWLLLVAESGVTNYSISWGDFTNQLWARILGGTNYGAFTVIGPIASTNVVLPATFQTNYTLSVTNSLEQEIFTSDTNINLTVAAVRPQAPVTLWINALTSTVDCVLTPPLLARTNIGFVSTITNGTARPYFVEWRGGVFSSNLFIISGPSAVR